MGLITQSMMVQAAFAIDHMNHAAKVRLVDEIYARQPCMLASVLALPRMGVNATRVEQAMHILLVTYHAMALSGHPWPLITEDVQEVCLTQLTARARAAEDLPHNLASAALQRFCDEHRERFLLAFVYGHLRECGLAEVRTEAEKYAVMCAVNLVECVAFVGGDMRPK